MFFFYNTAYCCNMEAFLTGISFLQGKKVKLSPFFGLLSFIDTPKIYDQALILEGKVSQRYDLWFLHCEDCSAPEATCIPSDTAFCFQQVKAVYFNNTPIPDKLVHLSLDAMSSSRLLQNLTTDSDGVAAFSLNTTSFKGNILLLVSKWLWH